MLDNLASQTPVVESRLDAVRAALLAQIAQRPVLKPARYSTRAVDEARSQRRGRLAHAQRILALIEGNTRPGAALGVAPRTVSRWRAGTHCPTSGTGYSWSPYGACCTRSSSGSGSGLGYPPLDRFPPSS
jgi:hypothetical protein